MKNNFCIVCDRKKVIPEEGRYISGNWYSDTLLPKEFLGKWVCCYSCYRKLLEKYRAKTNNNSEESTTKE